MLSTSLTVSNGPEVSPFQSLTIALKQQIALLRKQEKSLHARLSSNAQTQAPEIPPTSDLEQTLKSLNALIGDDGFDLACWSQCIFAGVQARHGLPLLIIHAGTHLLNCRLRGRQRVHLNTLVATMNAPDNDPPMGTPIQTTPEFEIDTGNPPSTNEQKAGSSQSIQHPLTDPGA
ncbi:MAG TPA: hypothetical protein VGI45_31805 [Terracidiphilus sp.]|jgi:hypothetical protein